MADDNNQRPYRGNDPYARGPAPGHATNNDPLAELARLIGQNDPFAEFGREPKAPAAPAPRHSPSASQWDELEQSAQYAAPPVAPRAPQYGQQDQRSQFPVPGFERQTYEMPPEVNSGDLYGDTDYRQDGYYHDPHADQDTYDDVPPMRRRVGIMAIAGVLMLLVVGVAGAFGYRALFGTGGSTTPPPVIKAETAPSKVVPATSSDQTNKLIQDRLGDRSSQPERLVSREEPPVDMKGNPRVVFPGPTATAGAQQAAASGTEPKKVRTIAIRPDQLGAEASAAPVPVSQPAVAPPPSPPPARVVASVPARTADIPPAPALAPPPPRTPPVQAAAAQPASAPVASNAPLSLSPGGAPPPAPARSVAAPPSLAPAAASAAASATGGAYVQVASQRSEAEAQASFQSMKGKFPNVLNGREAVIRRADLGDKGVYYRALVGPFASGSDAADLCTSLKAAGGSCLIQRN